MSSQPLRLSVVVAAYNEEALIAQNLGRIVDELMTRPQVEWELICINDGSSDNTGVLLEGFARSRTRVKVLHHRRNFGQGRALRNGFNLCRGDIIVTLDADLSYGPEYIYCLVDALQKQKVEIALTSPYAIGGTLRNIPFYRHILSHLANVYLTRMGHFRISTSTSVVRAYRREVIDTLVLSSDGMELQLEVLMKAAMMGFQVCEVPAHLRWADQKAAQANFRRVSKMRILQTIRLYLLMGWLSRPASLFTILSLLLFLAGFYMAIILSGRTLGAIFRHMNEGLIQAVSSGMNEVFSSYTYSFVFCGGFLLVGFQVFAFSLLLLQNKFHFEELYRLGLYRRKQAQRGRSDEDPSSDDLSVDPRTGSSENIHFGDRS